MAESAWWLYDLGTFFVIFGALMVGERMFNRFFLRRRIKKVVVSSNEDFKKALNPDAEYVPVEIRSMPGLKVSFYEEVTAEFSQLGFRAGSDLENRHLTGLNPWMRTCERTFFCANGQIAGNCFHLRTRGWRRILLYLIGGKPDVFMVVFSTWLDDGALVLTARSNMESMFSDPADVYGFSLPETTPVPGLLKEHFGRVQEVMNERGVQSFKPIRNDADFVAFHSCLARKQMAHREELGAVTAEEFEKLPGSLDRSSRKILSEEAEKFQKGSSVKDRPVWLQNV